MQEEVENRTVNLAISTTKLTGRTSLPYREDWRREEARDAGDSFYILIKTDD